jgi:hypothetical protein
MNDSEPSKSSWRGPPNCSARSANVRGSASPTSGRKAASVGPQSVGLRISSTRIPRYQHSLAWPMHSANGSSSPSRTADTSGPAPPQPPGSRPVLRGGTACARCFLSPPSRASFSLSHVGRASVCHCGRIRRLKPTPHGARHDAGDSLLAEAMRFASCTARPKAAKAAKRASGQRLVIQKLMPGIY